MKDKKTLFIISIVFLLIITTSLSYAYFSISAKGNENAKDVVVETGILKLTYTDSPEIVASNIKPGWTTTKVVIVKNTGTLDTSYNLVWQELINGITNNELVISATCERLNSSNVVEGTCEGLSITSINDIIIKKNIFIEKGITHKYTFTIIFKEMNTSQDYNQNKKFNGVIGVSEYRTDGNIYCTYNGNMDVGSEYVNGKFTYRYKQTGKYIKDISKIDWENADGDGWGVQLNDKESIDTITSDICTYINNKPVLYASLMFANSKAETIDLSKMKMSNIQNYSGMFTGVQAKSITFGNIDTSSATTMTAMFEGTKFESLDVSKFNTSNVTDMSYMFNNTKLTTLTGLENFDTSNVTDMYAMFSGIKLTSINLSSFNTSNVTNMRGMFSNIQATTLDLSNFDTSNVTDMNSMFFMSQVSSLDLSNFDTSKVTNMSSMFFMSQASSLDLSNFDTSNVTNMNSMFYNSKATTLDLSNFNTSKVTNMALMFAGSQATTIDVSNFDTSNVTDMRSIFARTQVVTLDVSNFDTGNVTNMYRMFYNTPVTMLDLSNFDTSNVTDMKAMFSNSSNLKTIHASDKFNTNAVTSDDAMFEGCTSLVGGSGTTYNSTKIDKTYAHIDGGTSNPGYFTSK